jgi:hypothetical protein
MSLGPFSGPGLAGCVQPLLHRAAGAVIPAGAYPALVLELAGPRQGQCWNLTSVVIRCHIGSKHYVGTYPEVNTIACGAGGTPP